MPAMDTLVTTQWLSEHLGEPDLVVLDCSVLVLPDEQTGFRLENGAASYAEGHIPTAGFADLMGPLSAADSQLSFSVPSPENFAAAMGALGVGDNTRVVLYDSSNSAWAARVWWMLRWIGFDRAALLDGGLTAWKAEGRPLSTEPSALPARKLSVALRPELIIDRDQVRAAMADENVTLIDALSPGHYRGEFTMYDRPGHIPGAINLPLQSLISESGHFRSQDDLGAM
ncbi:MAG: sulfurtransferase, partial [Xanthomonadales bacterium]|nr:sulfurtransferase [Xanthomonadales bacterium]